MVDLRPLRSRLINLLQSPEGEVLKILCEDLKKRWRETSIKSDNEWESHWKAMEKELKPLAIKELFDEMERIIQSQ